MAAEAKEKETLPLVTDSEAAANRNASNGEPVTDLEFFRHRVDGFISKADELEKRVKEVTQFYDSKRRMLPKVGNFGAKVKVGNGHCKKGDVQLEATCSKGMQELMRQLGTILKQISQHKWAWPFMEPVDVEGLNLDDYYEVYSFS